MNTLKRKYGEGSRDIRSSQDLDTFTDATICCIGIDFGTSQTGYAFAFNHNKEVICKEPGGQDAKKTRTSLLLDIPGTCIAFGSKAIQMYYEGANEKLLFERFKMQLCSQDSGSAQVKALNGKELLLIDVITETLKFIKTDALSEINKTQFSDINLDQIQWILTVPAIWNDIAKAVMRKAAFKAGLIKEECSARLELVLEPEAACIACEEEHANLQRGDEFMILDCGGGTVDITMHRVSQKLPQLQMDEICPPSGGPWGSTFLDEEFERFIERLVGPEAFRRFKPSSQWVEVMRTWEQLKLTFDPSKDTGDDIKRPINVNLVLEVADNASLSSLVEAYNRSYGASLGMRGQSILLLPTAMILSFFKPVISKIVSHVTELLKVHDVKYIFLVGGFAESKLLYHRVHSEFQKAGRRIVVPMRPGLAVVKGAVMLGLGASQRFASRIARHTYGISIFNNYDPSNPDHRGRRVFTQSEGGRPVTKVDDVFFPVVRQGARVAPGEIRNGGDVTCRADSAASLSICLFTTTNPAAKWTTDDGMKPVATVTVPCRRGDVLSVELCFGMTEIKARVNNKTSGSLTPVAMDYDFSKL